MELKLEHIDQEIENHKRSLIATNSAIAVLEGVKRFMLAPEPVSVNEEIEKQEAARQQAVADAIPVEQIAEAVAGPGAVVEAIEPITEASDTNAEIERRIELAAQIAKKREVEEAKARMQAARSAKGQYTRGK